MFLVSGACCFLMTEASPRSKGAAFKAGWCWSEPGRSLPTCGKGFITRLGFRLALQMPGCLRAAWGGGAWGSAPSPLPSRHRRCSEGADGLGGEQSQPSPPYTDPSSQTCWKQLPSNSFFLAHPSHASCWRVAQWKLTSSE